MNLKLFLLAIVISCPIRTLRAQTDMQERTNTSAIRAYTNTAVIPVKHGGKRSGFVMQRSKDHPGEYDIVFIGDSITEGWERPGKSVWEKFYGSRKCLNLGVGGDRTQHVLWRFEHGQLDGLKPKVTVVMIGTNNSNGNDNTEKEILEGVIAVVNQIRCRLPDTKIILFGIFPRGKTFSTQRGKILQVNEALEKSDNGKNIFYMDIGSQLIEGDGSISPNMMHDALHPNGPGYKIWAEVMEPKLRQLLGK